MAQAKQVLIAVGLWLVNLSNRKEREKERLGYSYSDSIDIPFLMGSQLELLVFRVSQPSNSYAKKKCGDN